MNTLASSLGIVNNSQTQYSNKIDLLHKFDKVLAKYKLNNTFFGQYGLSLSAVRLSFNYYSIVHVNSSGGGPKVVVSTAAFHAIHVWKSVLWGASVTER